MRFVRPLLVLFLTAGLVLVLPAGVPAAVKPGAVRQAAKKKKHHHHHGFSGTVVKVHHNKQHKGAGYIQVHVHHKKHNPQAAKQPAALLGNQAQQPKPGANQIANRKKKHPHVVKIHIHPSTKVEVVGKAVVASMQTRKVGKTTVKIPTTKLATKHIPTGFHSVHKGQHVHVTMHKDHQHHAKEVQIMHLSSQLKNPSKRK